VAAALVLAGCASVPTPTEAISNAELAIRKAEEIDASHHAPLEMRIARERLDGATSALAAESNLEARRLAEQAIVEAQLAEVKTRTARAKAEAEEARLSIEALRGEIERAGERSP
jgi:hypothetical protein